MWNTNAKTTKIKTTNLYDFQPHYSSLAVGHPLPWAAVGHPMLWTAVGHPLPWAAVGHPELGKPDPPILAGLRNPIKSQSRSAASASHRPDPVGGPSHNSRSQHKGSI